MASPEFQGEGGIRVITIEVDRKTCKGDGRCVEVCPMQILRMNVAHGNKKWSAEMAGMKEITLFLIFLCLFWKIAAGEVQQRQPYAFEEIKTETIDGVIVPEDRAREFYYSNKVQSYFTPLEDDVLKAESRVINYIDDHTPQFKGYPFVPDLEQKLANYKRQYVGLIMSGRKKIWLNFFCRTNNIDWKRYSFRVFGAGACYFNVLYDIDSAAFSELWINGLDIRSGPDRNESDGNKERDGHKDKIGIAPNIIQEK